MRCQKDVLLSALRPFYFDPLLDWLPESSQRSSKSHSSSSGSDKSDSGEIVNDSAVAELKAIEYKLDGHVTSYRKMKVGGTKTSNITLPMSVAGQVNFLIKEATSVENLSQMYIGWSPYM